MADRWPDPRVILATDAENHALLGDPDALAADERGGPSGLATSGHAWGAFADGRLVSVACSFFVGERFEDIGVATAEGYRGRGLALACARGLSMDIRDRGRRPSWTTSPDNRASLRVTEKLGFAQERTDRLLVVGRDIPTSAR